MKNNGEKLEGLMIAAMLLIFVTSIWAFRDAQRMHEKLAEKVQQTPETAEFAEFVSHLLPATPETAKITPFDASDPHMNFVASKERLKLTLNSCVPLSLDDTTVCIPIQSIGERSLVSYQTQDHTACVGAYHMTLVNGHKEEGVNPPTTKVAGFPSFKERNLLTKWYSNPSASKSRRTNSPQES